MFDIGARRAARGSLVENAVAVPTHKTKQYNKMIKMKCLFVTRMGTKKKIESPRGSSPWPPRYRLGATTEND